MKTLFSNSYKLATGNSSEFSSSSGDPCCPSLSPSRTCSTLAQETQVYLLLLWSPGQAVHFTPKPDACNSNYLDFRSCHLKFFRTIPTVAIPIVFHNSDRKQVRATEHNGANWVTEQTRHLHIRFSCLCSKTSVVYAAYIFLSTKQKELTGLPSLSTTTSS